MEVSDDCYFFVGIWFWLAIIMLKIWLETIILSIRLEIVILWSIFFWNDILELTVLKLLFNGLGT